MLLYEYLICVTFCPTNKYLKTEVERTSIGYKKLKNTLFNIDIQTFLGSKKNIKRSGSWTLISYIVFNVYSIRINKCLININQDTHYNVE